MFLSIGAQYSNFMVDALNWNGFFTQSNGVLELPKDVDSKKKLRERGVITSLPRPQMFIREEHYGKRIAGGVVTMELGPVKNHAYGVCYARGYELQSMSSAPACSVYRYDETWRVALPAKE